MEKRRRQRKSNRTKEGCALNQNELSALVAKIQKTMADFLKAELKLGITFFRVTQGRGCRRKRCCRALFVQGGEPGPGACSLRRTRLATRIESEFRGRFDHYSSPVHVRRLDLQTDHWLTNQELPN
jgi:hypothetical protein